MAAELQETCKSGVPLPDLGPLKLATRGTTNRNERGSAEDRRRRRVWLVETYRADTDVFTHWGDVELPELKPVTHGLGIPACRCYRCGCLLTVDTVTVDRIIPGCKGGTYRRNNIRPACGTCNYSEGARLAGKGKR